MMRMAIQSLLVALSFVFSSRSPAQTFEQFATTVVFLEHSWTETVKIEDRVLEVWLKEPSGTNMTPKRASATGTGFLLVCSSNIYLVTAKHVANTLGFTENDTITMGLNEGKSVVISLALLRVDQKADWLHHEKSDVSVLPLSPLDLFRGLVLSHSADVSQVIHSWTNAPRHDVTLTVMGFPLGVGSGRTDGDEFAPVLRRTRAATGLLDHGTAFLLEDPSVQGYSGSPVFDLNEPLRLSSFATMSGGGSPSIFGVVSATFSDNTGGKLGKVIAFKCVGELIEKHLKSSNADKPLAGP